MRRRLQAFYDQQEEDLCVIVAALIADQIFRSTVQRRVLWIRNRSQSFTAITVSWDDLEWKRNFRVNRTTFRHLCSELSGKLQHASTVRAAISVETRVAIALWRLGTNVEYRTISHLFGVGISTACVIVHEVYRAIVDVLLKRYIRIPTGPQAMDIVRGFEHQWGFPQCFGAIDGSHIPIIALKDSHADYYNRKGFYSIVLQALVDHQYRFLNVYTGWPGSVHDARVLLNSKVYARGEAGTLMPSHVWTLGGVPVPVVIIGDPAYPLLPWLMKAYPGTGLSDKQKKYNRRLSRARVVVECAFGRLKGRWRSLLKRNDMRLDYLCNAVIACCVLHNICEVHQDAFDEQWLVEVTPVPRPSSTGSILPTSSTASSIRNAFSDYLDAN